jgi:hypothetical protein
MARIRWAILIVLALSAVSYAGGKGGDNKDKPKSGTQMVDSGSFGVFVRGQRVITETFSVQQENGASVVKAQVQQVGSSSAGQSSELHMTGTGELLRYQWNDGNSSLVVTPNNEFLLEKITPSPGSKPAEQPFLMPNTSAILDNNFFIHREVLVWRYLAADCHTDAGALKCLQGPVEFGVLVPQDRTSMRVRFQLVGREKVMIRGTERELLRLNLIGEEFKWTLWVDDKDQFKMIRVLVADDNTTEVLRD